VLASVVGLFILDPVIYWFFGWTESVGDGRTAKKNPCRPSLVVCGGRMIISGWGRGD
jgi:hypothetical protein